MIKRLYQGWNKKWEQYIHKSQHNTCKHVFISLYLILVQNFGEVKKIQVFHERPINTHSILMCVCMHISGYIDLI